MPRPRAATTVRKTPHFDFLFGKYSHSKIKVPYFQISMTFGDAASYLRLVSEMPDAASMEWQIEELFQRDIDWGRVERKIVPYLRQEQQPQFFNSLTIALLPFKNDSIHAFDGVAWRPPSLDDEGIFEYIHDFGPIRCGYWQKWEDVNDDAARLGQLIWNTEEICGVAIDGQHRLAAIKQLMSGGADAYGQCTVPVILVVLDPTLGYTGTTDRSGMIETLRRLFIDLNKHAKVPSRARQILLDDRDPSSICVRAVVGTQLKAGRAELAENPPRLPLSLVDWHSEQAKFETGPYLTTVLGLDWTVAKLLRIKPLHDLMAYESVANTIDTLERQLEIDLSNAQDRLAECRRYERPFAFVDDPEDELALMAEGFMTAWCAPLVYLLTELLPYRELIAKREHLDTLRPEFANWCALKQRADDARAAGAATHLLNEFERHLADREEEPIAAADLREAIEALDEVKDRRELAFNVVFQRALILAFRQLTKVTSGMVSDPDQDEDQDIDDLLDEEEEEQDADAATEPNDVKYDRATQLVIALNHVIEHEPDFLRKECEFKWPNTDNYDRFWVGSLVQMEGPIDFTQAASTRASDILMLVALLWIYRTNEGVTDFEELVERSEAASRGLDLKYQQCIGRLKDSESSVAGRILKAREEELTDEATEREVLGRTEWLWSIITTD